jgi:hypothetical protein
MARIVAQRIAANWRKTRGKRRQSVKVAAQHDNRRAHYRRTRTMHCSNIPHYEK